MQGVFKDFTGQTFGRLKVVGFNSWHIQPSGQKKTKWDCLCECGTTTVVQGANLSTGHTLSCGCVKREAIAAHKAAVSDGSWIPSKLEGRKYGRLTVIKFDRWKISKDDIKSSYWKCICDCGKSCIKPRYSFCDTSSCGCYKSEVISAQRTTHGYGKTPTYKSWCKMKERCGSDSYVEKEYYQDLGIVICERWLNSFENFLEDMGERPEGKTLDRIKVTEGYSPENCRWADGTIQSYNTRRRSNNKSGRTGVYENDNGTFWASITHYKDHIKLVNNVSFDEAVAARAAAELKYYGVNKE